MGYDSWDEGATPVSNPGQIKQKNCSNCGVAFHCGTRNDGTQCWCDDMPKLFPVVERDCVCPACFGDAIALQPIRPKQPLVGGEDYYTEGKVIVFTARYHLRRGHCCGSGCRHCPYR
jgi:hypothetical protein